MFAILVWFPIVHFLQVKEANKLLKILPNGDGKKKMVGVPVFSAQNLDIAIATNDGIKWWVN